MVVPPPHPNWFIAPFRAVWRWGKTLATLGGKLMRLESRVEALEAELAAALDRDRDARARCPSCGDGRIGGLYAEVTRGFLGKYGTCGGCGIVWLLDDTTGEPRHPKLRSDQR